MTTSPDRDSSLTAVLALFAALCCPAHAEVFKCADAKGKASYQDYPCGEASQSEWRTRTQIDEKAAADERLKRRNEASAKAVADEERRLSVRPVTDWASLYAGAEKQRKENDAAIEALKPGDRITGLPSYILREARITQTQTATHKHVDYCLKYVGRVHLYAINDVIQSKSLSPGQCEK